MTDETCEMTFGNRTGLNRSGMQLVLFGARSATRIFGTYHGCVELRT